MVKHTYLVFPDDQEQGVARFFSNLNKAKKYASSVAQRINLNVRVWREPTSKESPGLLRHVTTIRPAYLKNNPTSGTRGGVRAQVRRLPSGQVQIKIPLKRNEDPLRKAQQIAKALGKRIVSVAGAGTKRRTGRRS